MALRKELAKDRISESGFSSRKQFSWRKHLRNLSHRPLPKSSMFFLNCSLSSCFHLLMSVFSSALLSVAQNSLLNLKRLYLKLGAQRIQEG